MSVTSQAAEVVDQYLDAFYRGDFETARTLLADDLSFNGSENPTVPEPASMLLLGGGLAGLARILRGRKR